ncbi:MAG: 2-amino-4-hydroxy-6-hydroxymethyldihydropteridine diphosphokinase [Bacteroidales bacterium]|nr:2-amino-4-hydroxy-6-hydroxymethyldihydropteridine diphosphokinase [Bacteroidales bacterium]
MNIVYLLLGSNMDDRTGMLRLAREAIQSRIGEITRESSIYETEPWGFQSGDLFLNQVIRIKTDYLPAELMGEILKIEEDLGRRRRQFKGYMPRTIDIDILFYNDEIIQDEHLVIPHPRMQERMFALIPLMEIDHMMTHPASHKTIGQLVSECPDQLKVNCYLGK